MFITKTKIKTDEGIVEIAHEPLPDEAVDRGVVTGYWKSPGDKTYEKLEPYFFLTEPGRVDVTTNVWGRVDVSLHLYNESARDRGLSLPQSGGVVSLGPGQWRLYFQGWITSYPDASGIGVSVSSAAIAARDERAEGVATVTQ